MIETSKLKLYLVTDPHLCASFGLLNTVNAAIKGGITMVQLRDKEASTRERVEIGRALKKILNDSEIPLIINDDIEAAVAIDADGIHVGQSDENTIAIRSKIGKEKGKTKLIICIVSMIVISMIIASLFLDNS